jgi:hypothetical protein
MKFDYTVDYPNKMIIGVGRTFFGIRYQSQTVCSPTDTFSIPKGKEIVRLKIAKQQLKFIEKTLNRQIKCQTQGIDELYASLNYLNNRKRKLLKRKEKVEERLKEM